VEAAGPAPTATPGTDRTIELHDGRALAFCEWGDLDGAPVVLFHGMPGSRMFCPDERATADAGVWLITIDRPGYGRSDPKPGRGLTDWAEDFAGLSEALELPPCPIVGWSSGGPNALACAIRAPDRVSSVGLAAAVGPYGEVPGSLDAAAPELRALIELLRRDPEAALDRVRRRCWWYAEDWEQIFAGIGSDPDHDDPDDRLMARPEIMEPMRAWFREGARQGSEGYVEDWIAEQSSWGFSAADVSHEVHVWAGEQDRLVGPEHGTWLADTIPRATLVTYPNAGHLFPITHWAEILAALCVPFR